MLEAQKGSVAIGSRRVMPTSPVAAAVVSLAIVAPTNTPCCQSNDSYTSGATRALRPPKINAEIGTPSGASHFGEILGDCRRSEEHTSELQSHLNLVCRLLLEKK